MRRNEYLSLIVAFLLITLFPLIAYHNLYQAGQVFGNGDLFTCIASFLFTSSSVLSGDGIPIWAPWLANGIPYLADLSFPVLYPPIFIFGFLPANEYIYLYYGFHLAIGSVFFYLYLRELGCQKRTSLFVAILYLFSIHLGGLRKEHIVIINTVVWLPVLLFFVEHYMRTTNRCFFLLLVVGMTLQFFGGFVQDTLYTDIFIFIYFIVISRRMDVKWDIIILRCIGLIFSYIGLIAVRLLPALELLKEYSTSGTQHLSMEAFRTGSIAPWKLIMVLFPKFYGNDVYNFGDSYVSSGMDIEIFMGSIFFVFFCLAFRYLNNFYIRFSLMTLLIVFFIAAHANLPGISSLLFQIPVINNMRYLCRILFIFIFFGYVIFALVFEECQYRDEWKILSLYAKYCLGFAVCLAICNGWYFGSDDFWITVWNRTGNNIIVLAVFSILMYGLFLKSYRYTAILVLITLISLWEVFPFWHVCNVKFSKDLFLNPESVLKKDCLENGSQYKILDARVNIEGFTENPVGNNTPLNKRIMAINSYMAFNNPHLYQYLGDGKSSILNASGLFIRFKNASELLHNRQSVLSMLGIKYIIDSSNILNQDSNAYQLVKDKNPILYKERINFLTQQPYQVMSFPLEKINPNTTYGVSFSCMVNRKPDVFYVDFYDAGAGDNVDPELLGARVDFILKKGQLNWFGYISCRNHLRLKKPVLRIVSDTKEDLLIQDFMVNSYQKNKIGDYIKICSEENQMIFDNPNAKSLFYVPQKLEYISSFTPLYQRPEIYQVDKVTYLTDVKDSVIKSAFKSSIANISHLCIENNKASAVVNAQSDTFINFSQNWYPGWKAFIDGKETKVFLVNGIIQGVFVPAGKHELTFCYFPDSLKWGILISFLTLVAVIFCVYRDKILR